MSQERNAEWAPAFSLLGSAMGLDSSTTPGEETPAKRAPGNAPESIAHEAPSPGELPHQEEPAAPREPGAFTQEDDDEAEPRDPGAFADSTPADDSTWKEPQRQRDGAAPRARSYTPPPGKPGRKPDPKSPRRFRTYADRKARAVTAEEKADVRAFAAAIMEELLVEARNDKERAQAREFGRAEGVLTEPPPAAAPAAPGGAPPTALPMGEAAAAAPPPPPPELLHGHPVERMERAMGVIMPAVETLAAVARFAGLDLTAQTERVVFRNTKFERKLTADPLPRMAELFAAEACDRAAKSDAAGPGAGKGDRRMELGLLMAATFGPAALVLAKAAAAKLGVGALALYHLVKRKRSP